LIFATQQYNNIYDGIARGQLHPAACYLKMLDIPLGRILDLVKRRERVSVAVSVKRDRKRDLTSDEVCQRRVSDRIGRDERGEGGQMEARIALRY